MKKYKLSELILDFELYPRGSVDSHHAGEIASAIEAGASMPPIVIDKKSKRITDGFHRWKAYRQLFDEDYQVECVEKTYKNEGEMLLDAMRFNASHGRALTSHDKAHCLIIAKKFKLSDHLVAQALNLTTGKIGTMRATKIGRIGRKPIALKRTIKHMAEKTLTKTQVVANEKLSGMNQLFYVNQIKILIENDLIDMENGDLLTGLNELKLMLDRFCVKVA
jgi:hypothetical protein